MMYLVIQLVIAVVATVVVAQEPPYPVPGPNEPVMAGYDLVAYHRLQPGDNGIPGKASIQYRHTNGYVYYFSSEANKKTFMENPTQYLPAYGGFCAFGIAYEFPDQGWPWAPNHMGPPCGPRDGWEIIDGVLYCSINRSYQMRFSRQQEESIRIANDRWIQFYGTLTTGPQNNGCYEWNWPECIARSIHTSVWSSQEEDNGGGGREDEDPGKEDADLDPTNQEVDNENQGGDEGSDEDDKEPKKKLRWHTRPKGQNHGKYKRGPQKTDDGRGRKESLKQEKRRKLPFLLLFLQRSAT